jgi:hypothetical protein
VFASSSSKTRDNSAVQPGLWDGASAPPKPLSLKDEINAIHELFFSIFVEDVVQKIEGEEAIWLIEETPDGRFLHVWERR